AHALESAGIVFVSPSVGIVLRYRCTAQIGPTVVRGITVAMVDERWAPFAGHVQPGKVMGSVNPAFDSDPQITVAIECPCKVTRLGRLAQAFAPAKFSGF